jgi:spore coat protein U-like protein
MQTSASTPRSSERDCSSQVVVRNQTSRCCRWRRVVGRVLSGMFAVAVASAVHADRAHGQTASDAFQVSITVQNECTITVNDLDFGTVSDLVASVDGATTGTVTCTGVAPVSIAFDAGTGGSSTYGTRQMASGGETINYNLYREPTHTEVLGDGTGGTFVIELTSTGGADGFSVYARTAPGQNPKPAGAYTSTVTATVSF